MTEYRAEIRFSRNGRLINQERATATTPHEALAQLLPMYDRRSLTNVITTDQIRDALYMTDLPGELPSHLDADQVTAAVDDIAQNLHAALTHEN